MNDKIRAQQYDSGAAFSFIQGALAIVLVGGTLAGLCIYGGWGGYTLAALSVVALAGVLKG